jgi:hypothetical protein
MKAYYQNGKLRFIQRRSYGTLKFTVAVMAAVLVVFAALSLGNSDFKIACGIEIPGLKDQTFCIAHNENGIYYYNEKFEVKVK